MQVLRCQYEEIEVQKYPYADQICVETDVRVIVHEYFLVQLDSLEKSDRFRVLHHPNPSGVRAQSQDLCEQVHIPA